MLVHQNSSLRVDMSLHSDTLFWFRANQPLLLLLIDAYLEQSNKHQFYNNLDWYNRDSNSQSTPLEASMLTSMNVNSIISWLVILNLNGSVLNIWIFFIALFFVYTTDYIYGHIVTRQVPHLEQELLILPEHPSSSQVFSGFHFSRSLGFCVMFCGSLFVLLSFLLWPLWCLSFDLRFLSDPFGIFGHCNVCPSIYSF